MKANIEVVAPGGIFVPFALHIEIETRNEARALWHRLNMDFKDITSESYPNSCTCVSPELIPGMDGVEAFIALDNYMAKHNYKGND